MTTSTTSIPTSLAHPGAAGPRTPQPHCARLPRLFQDPLLEEATGPGSTAAERRRYADLVAAAATACRSCPLVTACLYRAVVEHDVAGYVGGTTPAQRAAVRRRLGVVVPQENLDSLAGVVGGPQVDHDQVVRLRAAHPDESLEVLAGRLGCSLSTVKRHLRRERNAPAAPAPAAPRPPLVQVLAAVAEVTGAERAGRRAA